MNCKCALRNTFHYLSLIDQTVLVNSKSQIVDFMNTSIIDFIIVYAQYDCKNTYTHTTDKKYRTFECIKLILIGLIISF